MVAHLALGLQKLFNHNSSPFTIDVTALHDFYRVLNNPLVLKGWQSDGGDPCEKSWDGVSCVVSPVIYLNLSHNLLSGPTGDAFTGLRNLRQLTTA
ncbi:protein STRUBBELIG-RECEPTOR FAMILY 4-like isoform X2 [Malus domestica]|uniref:protein STRUBBELIG-RECEPTOR FAMILY 4-like isoform X2 n=1 Tax=Malus domestica TaxID=3750 RepID=UPI0039771137